MEMFLSVFFNVTVKFWFKKKNVQLKPKGRKLILRQPLKAS